MIEATSEQILETCNLVEPEIILQKTPLNYGLVFSEEAHELYREFVQHKDKKSYAFADQKAHPAYRAILALRKQVGIEIKAMNDNLSIANKMRIERERNNASVQEAVADLEATFIVALKQIEAAYFEDENTPCTLSVKSALSVNLIDGSDFDMLVRLPIVQGK